jgi:hypothetical protein
MDPKLRLRLDSIVLSATPNCSSSAELPRHLPWHLASALRDVLIRAPAELLNPNIVSELRSIIRARQIPNYERHWAAFAYLYYHENFQKAYLAAHYFLSRSFDRVLRIIDLGCGGGASTAGVICALQAIGPHPPLIEKTIGVDTSPSQLELFHWIVKR